MPRDKLAKQSLGAIYRLVKESRILLVGAGGIGCELLKNLVLTGFGEVHVIDLDTIDLSNLNRQFLFRHEHIKKPKATVAKEAAQRFNPNVKLTAYHSNIKDSQFNVAWFSSFTLVFNALDNLDARRHVNKMCLAADVPLIESGTTGFNGQVQVIKKGRTACYECAPKMTPKSFPVCTVRSTPSQPIHCIVWAKSYLLPELFGESEEKVEGLDTSQDSDNAQEIAKLKMEAEALSRIRESMGTHDFSRKVFDMVFKDDIERLANTEGMWKDQKPPQPLAWDSLTSESASIHPTISQTDQRIWTKSECFVVLRDSLTRLSRRLADEEATALKTGLPKPMIEFDKDDDDTLDFVTAAGNLRASIFGIEPKSKFDTKQMAGNIIPAIATTNAMVAGLCVLQSFKVLKGEYGRTKMIFLDKGKMTAGIPDPPNPDCAACGLAMSRVQIDPERATLKDLVQDVLQLKLGYGEEISVLNESGVIYEPDLEDNLEKKLEELSIKDGSFIHVQDDEEENPRVDLRLAVEAKKMEEDTTPVALVQRDDEKLEIARKPKKRKDVGMDGAINGEVKVNGDGNMTANTIVKRKRDNDDIQVEGTPAKKLAQQQLPGKNGTDVNQAIVLDEMEEGAIVLDD